MAILGGHFSASTRVLQKSESGSPVSKRDIKDEFAKRITCKGVEEREFPDRMLTAWSYLQGLEPRWKS